MLKKVVEIRMLNYAYPDGTVALRNINLDIFEGASIAIIGPNGAGKSTLLLHLNGILKGDGIIKILGRQIDQKNLAEIRSRVGLVFQDPDNQLFMPTVFDDVSFGPINMGLSKEEVITRVNEALQEVDMLSASGRVSHHLSFGEKKRIAIATVLAMRPEILILDEPSSNLDPRHRRDLIHFLKKKTLTKIVATHDLDLVWEVCSEVFLIDSGKLITVGRVKDILTNKLLLEEYNLEVPASVNYKRPDMAQCLDF
jgi:cobalt/nickel transport system ATP-binding protein